jgi:hypothetical protein
MISTENTEMQSFQVRKGNRQELLTLHEEFIIHQHSNLHQHDKKTHLIKEN